MKAPPSNHSATVSHSEPVAATRYASQLLLLLLSSLVSFDLTAGDTKQVTLMRTAEGGIQPQAVMDSQGAVHLIYYKGEAGGGDIFYVRGPANEGKFSKPLQIGR